MMEQRQTIFDTYACDLFAAEKKFSFLKDHPQIPVIIDILSRKTLHHLIMTGSDSDKFNFALMENLATYLSEHGTPTTLRNADLIYFDIKRLAMSSEKKIQINRDFAAFKKEHSDQNKCVVLILNEFPQNEYLENLINSFLMNEQWRLIIFSNECSIAQDNLFATLKLPQPTESQFLSILKIFKTELEIYHDVTIPDETCASALSMTTHYLNAQSNIDKTLELLDSAAARASVANEKNEQLGQFKAVVTSVTLAHVISSWTQIPLSHLHNNKFQATKFIESMQRRIFGQDVATATLGTLLQQSCIKLQDRSGPLCSFLLVGPPETGKSEAAYTMAHHLFGHDNALLRVNLSETCQTISDFKIMPNSNNSDSLSLLEAIQNTPYAIVLLENIHQTPSTTLNLFKNIFLQGYAIDAQGKKYDFRHAIIVVTTTLGADRIASLTQPPPVQDNHNALNLMQLILNETPQEYIQHTHHQLSPHELCEELLPILEGYFSPILLQHFNIVPFIPLDYSALEKVMRLKVKLLAKRLEMNFGIELSYAPEVIKFLAHETLWKKPSTKSLEKILEQHLYSCVAHEILAHTENKNRPKRLSLQLNDNGHVLRCEFVNSNEAMFI